MFLKRLRRAVKISGLTADPAALEGSAQVLLVSGRLAQAALHHLQEVSPDTGGKLAEELEAIASPDECELLTQGRGYTFFHVVHFLFEFARHYGDLADGRSFPAEVGWEGSGLHLEQDRDIISLMRLLVNAMPAGNDGRGLGQIVQTLSPLMLDRIFPAEVFVMELDFEGDEGLQIALRYADPELAREGLRAFGLERDAGIFFFTSALQIQETLRKGLEEMVQDAEETIALQVRIGERSSEEQAEIVRTCACAWTITWRSDMRFRRMNDPERVLEQVRILHATMHRRDLEYFQERVKTLEMRVQALEAGGRFHDLVGQSPQMQRIYRIIEQVAATDSTALIRGESGTGKELVARAIHRSSVRREKPFVAVNCAAFSESLLESELFGHEKGAFTGAERTKPGRFELADGGTLFLDEVGDIPLITQVKLLRAVETRSFERVGGTRTITTDVRFIGATNRDLEQMIGEGAFREDFYFRLDVLPVELPALRAALAAAGRVVGKPVPCIIGGNTEPILEPMLSTGTDYVICPAETDQAAFMARMAARPDVRVRVNTVPEVLSAGRWEDVRAEIDRVVALIGDRTNACIGTGALPFESDPALVQRAIAYARSGPG